MTPLITSITLFLKSSGAVIMAVLGGAVAYFWKVAEKGNFRWITLFLYMIFAFFTAWMIGKFTPNSVGENFRDGIMGISGLLSYEILTFIKSRAEKIIAWSFKKATGIDTDIK